MLLRIGVFYSAAVHAETNSNGSIATGSPGMNVDAFYCLQKPDDGSK
jgi:hypothetical protein